MHFSPNLEPICYSMCGSNWCFFTCIQVSQETSKVVLYSHLFKNFPQFVVIHPVKGFGKVNKAKVNGFLESSCFFSDPADASNLISGSSAFSKPSLYICKLSAHILLKPSLKDFERIFLACEMSQGLTSQQLYSHLNILWPCLSLGLE